jgi:hypothetical protein
MKRALVDGVRKSEEFQTLHSMRDSGADFTKLFKLEYTDE